MQVCLFFVKVTSLSIVLADVLAVSIIFAEFTRLFYPLLAFLTAKCWYRSSELLGSLFLLQQARKYSSNGCLSDHSVILENFSAFDWWFLLFTGLALVQDRCIIDSG